MEEVISKKTLPTGRVDGIYRYKLPDRIAVNTYYEYTEKEMDKQRKEKDSKALSGIHPWYVRK